LCYNPHVKKSKAISAFQVVNPKMLLRRREMNKKICLAILAILLLVSVLVLGACGGPAHYALSTSSSPAEGGSISPSGGSYVDKTEVTLIATPAAGYRFDHWGGNASGVSATFQIAMNSQKSVIAYFVRLYDLSVLTSPVGGGSVNVSNGTYDAGTEVTLIAVPAIGYRFDHWEGSISGTSDNTVITIDSDKTAIAVFSKVVYTLESRLNPWDGGSVDPAGGNYKAGATVTLTAIPAAGYRFDHWGGDVSGASATLNVVMDGNITVTAYFTRLYTLSSTSNPSDGGSVSPTRGTYDAGTVVNLTAAAALGYVFSNWNGTDNNGINPTTVTMTSDKSVTVYFTQLTPKDQTPVTGELYGQVVSIPIQLSAGQWVQGEIIANTYDIGAQIQDPNGNVVKELGRIRQASFSLQAQISGTYSFVIYENYGIGHNFYTLTYTIYS
jgi:hypothetical protein